MKLEVRHRTGGRWRAGSELVCVPAVSPAWESRLSWPVASVGTSILSTHDTRGHREPLLMPEQPYWIRPKVH